MKEPWKNLWITKKTTQFRGFNWECLGCVDARAFALKDTNFGLQFYSYLQVRCIQPTPITKANFHKHWTISFRRINPILATVYIVLVGTFLLDLKLPFMFIWAIHMKSGSILCGIEFISNAIQSIKFILYLLNTIEVDCWYI